MDRAGDEEFLRFLARQRIPTAEQQRRCQRGPLRREAGLQRPLPASPNFVEQGGERQGWWNLQHRDGPGAFGAHDRQATQRSGPLSQIKLPWIECRAGTHAAAEQADPAADDQIGGPAFDKHRGPASRCLPDAACPNPLHPQEPFAGLLHRAVPRRGNALCRQPLRRLEHHSLQGHRPGLGPEAPGQISGRKQIPAGCRPARPSAGN